jgi:hypothetical protein
LYNGEFKEFIKGYTIQKDAVFRETCLEFALERRLTNSLQHDKDKSKLLVGPSGSGKTRRCYEELFVTPGLFFTCAKQGNGGSADMEITIADAMGDPGKSNFYFSTLIWSRMMLFRYMKDELKFSSANLLLAQIHPEAVFGSDVFKDLYLKIRSMGVILRPWLFSIFVVVDEIQMALRGEKKFLLNSIQRTVFSPLWKSMITHFGYANLVMSGTGMDFQVLKDHLESVTFKDTPYELVVDIKPLTEEQVRKYCLLICTKRLTMSEEDANELAGIVCVNPLCAGGRARTTAFVLDQIINGKNVNDALESLNAIIINPSHASFPIRNWESKKDTTIGHQTYFAMVLHALVSYLQGKEAVIYLPENNMADLINIGLGFCKLNESYPPGVVLSELLVAQALFALFEPLEIANEFLKNLAQSLNSSIAGFHFEYLVMLKFYFDCPQDETFEILHGPLHNNLHKLNELKQGVIALFPDAYMGNE